MGKGEELVKNTKKLQAAGFSIGIYSVLYPSPDNLEAAVQMQFRCLDAGVDFRMKDFVGRYEGVDNSGQPFSISYGDYSRYAGSVFQKTKKSCLCKTTDLIISPNGNIYRCHRDLYKPENPVGNILDKDFTIEDQFRKCGSYGNCHPCDVKVKTDYKQQLGHTSVEIKLP
jgi:hypothetical protein